ncbi:FAD-dependent oxidoreductase (plasmid) [Nostoc edaphicum CCNP1411]|uniref:FAD-dependent oxidoreductase n=1 Tax=Nostoc edaphicum CCNP1411 TaxID=1472755 RepID=A0A7D7QHA9_9NOSO|nr:FAD-dependent oxidoreductase [Nostoc edaphicum]QMS86241.1 FAD-dependent oxidoreductase [Nostoc edaphicum CCNP1411]
MANPILLTVDDDPGVLRVIERDLRQQYGNSFRVLRADSGAKALSVLQQVKLRNEMVALFLVDQRMPQMTGVQFIEQAMQIFPYAKRVLLTAYADTNAAVSAINTAKIDYYLMKPWDPPQEILYPILNDLLDDWVSSYHPPFEGIRVIGSRWSPKSHQIKDFLARNHVPYQWLDIETEEEARQWVIYTQCDTAHLPLLMFPDGLFLTQPTHVQIAEKIGLKTRAEMPFYDLIIVGAGPAGLAAAVYGASEGLRTVLIEREAPGGQAGTSSQIENYLGFPSGLSGAELARRAVIQAKRFGVEILAPQEVVGIRLEDPYRIVKLTDGTELSCHALLIATGVSYRQLDVSDIDKLTGAGVYYGAAMSEVLSCLNEDVYIVGAANSAGQAAVYISKYARNVTILVRGDSLAKSMSKYLIDRILATENIKVQLNTSVIKVHGETNLEAITIVDAQTGEKQTVPTKLLFILIGARPHTDWLAGVLERDEQGFILTGSSLMREGRCPKGWKLVRQPFLLESNVPGIFVAGDVRYGSVKRVASGVGEGAIAVQFIHQYLNKV